MQVAVARGNELAKGVRFYSVIGQSSRGPHFSRPTFNVEAALLLFRVTLSATRPPVWSSRNPRQLIEQALKAWLAWVCGGDAHDRRNIFMEVEQRTPTRQLSSFARVVSSASGPWGLGNVCIRSDNQRIR